MASEMRRHNLAEWNSLLFSLPQGILAANQKFSLLT
jgi:hypothetical protein